MRTRPDSFAFYLAATLALAAAIHAIWNLALTLNQPLLEWHGFRQTQTALTAYWIQQNGPSLAYETPVLGFPFSIPFEFPIYQILAAYTSHISTLPLDQCGRLLSFVFFASIPIPIHFLLRRVTQSSIATPVFCTLFWTSPLYLFWSRTFMIELAALFFILCSLPTLHDLILQPKQISIRSTTLTGLFFTVGLLQKVTTGLPVALIATTLWLLALWRRRRERALVSEILALTFAIVVPVVIAIAWTHFSDVTKLKNPFGHHLTSKALTEWTFGTLAQRLSLRNWSEVIWERMLLPNVAGQLGIGLILIGLGYTGKLRKVLYLCILAATVPVLLFFNLHLVHDYYQCSCTVFFIIGLTLVITHPIAGKSQIPPLRILPLLLLLIVSASNSFYYNKGPYKYLARRQIDEASNPILQIARFIRENTPERSGLLVLGMDWSSELAYYAQRKAVTIKDSWAVEKNIFANPESSLGPIPLGAVIVSQKSSLKLDEYVTSIAFTKTYSRLKQIAGHQVLIYHPTDYVPKH